MNRLLAKFRDLAGINLFDSIYKTITFGDFFIATFPCCMKREIERTHRKAERAFSLMRTKKRVKVAFFLQSPTVWKYDRLYWLMQKSDRFEPIVVISPYNVHLNYDKSETLNVMRVAQHFAEQKGYNFISTYNNESRRWRNIRKEVNPDVVFHAKPYKDTYRAYHIYNFKDKANCFVPYGITCIDIYRTNFNLPFNNLLWGWFLETEFQQKMAQQYSLCKGENTIVTGSLGMEDLIRPDYQPKDVWKPQPLRKKRIIWAPHHTVDYLFNFSNFFTYCELMLQLAEKYQDEIQIAFKPHPVLKFKLINIWGKEKTEEYYQRWRDLPNGQLEDGAYIDLFATSDAMIHDCASFTAEYLYTQKPTMFIVKDDHTTDHLNSFGEKCFNLHYHAYKPSDVEDYVMNVVIAGNDTKKQERIDFYSKYLYPSDGVMPSDKIVKTIEEAIDGAK